MSFPGVWEDARQFEFQQGGGIEKESVKWLRSKLKLGDDAQLDLAVEEYLDGKFGGLCDGYSFCWMRAKLSDSANNLPKNSQRAIELYNTDSLKTALKAHLWFAGSNSVPQGPSAQDPKNPRTHSEWAHAASQPNNRMTYMTASNAKNRGELIGQIKERAGRCTQLDFPAKTLTEGRHSIAFYRSYGSSVYMFDSNYGEFRVAKNQLDAIVGSLFEQYKTTDEDLRFDDKMFGPSCKLKIWTLHTPLTKGSMLTKKSYGI